jgi:hypothetical protein
MLGACIGLFMAGQQWQASARPEPNRAVIPLQDLEMLLWGTVEDRPQLDQIVVHPTPTGYRLVARELQFRESIYTYSNINIAVPHIFRPRGDIRPPGDKLVFIDYMQWFSSRFPRIRYEYCWWEMPAWLFSSYVLIGIAMGGVVWPIAIRMMAGGTLQVDDPRKHYQFPVVVHETPSRKVLSSSKSATLQNVVAALENRREDRSTDSKTLAKQPSKAMSSTQLETGMDARNIAGDTKQARPAKHYGGNFYPTELHPDDTPLDHGM